MNNLKPLYTLDINPLSFFDLLIIYGTEEINKELDRKLNEIIDQVNNPSLPDLSILVEKLFTIRQMQDLIEQIDKRGYF